MAGDNNVDTECQTPRKGCSKPGTINPDLGGVLPGVSLYSPIMTGNVGPIVFNSVTR